MLRQITSLTTALAVLGLVSADCVLINNLKDDSPAKETRSQLCEVKDNSHYTFAMQLSEVAVPTFDGGAPWGGLADSKSLIIYDENCIPKGVYNMQQDNDCGIPYVMKDYWLHHDLKVTSIFKDTGSPYYKFTYGDKTYETGKNGCECNDMSHDLTGAVGCRCLFPLDG